MKGAEAGWDEGGGNGYQGRSKSDRERMGGGAIEEMRSKRIWLTPRGTRNSVRAKQTVQPQPLKQTAPGEN